MSPYKYSINIQLTHIHSGHAQMRKYTHTFYDTHVPIDLFSIFFLFQLRKLTTSKKELHKIVFDPRYILLTSKKRREILKMYIKESVEEEKQKLKEKERRRKNKTKGQRKQLRKLLVEIGKHEKYVYNLIYSSLLASTNERMKERTKREEREGKKFFFQFFNSLESL